MIYGLSYDFYLNIIIALIYLLVINKLDIDIVFNNRKHKIDYWMLNLFVAFMPFLNLIFTLFAISELMNEEKSPL